MNHNEKYDSLQNEYIETRNQKTLEKMYAVLVEISTNYLNKYKTRKGISVPDIEDKAHDSALFVIERYLKSDTFRVKKASAYIYFGVIKTLFKDKEYEMNTVSYDEYFNNTEFKEEENYENTGYILRGETEND